MPAPASSASGLAPLRCDEGTGGHPDTVVIGCAC